MYKRILGPLDGSRLSECSLEHIKSIAVGCRQAPQVILLTVLEQEPQSVSYYASTQEMAEEMAKQREKAQKQMRQKAEGYLAKVADNLKGVGIAVQTVVMPAELGKGAAETILDYVENNKVDLIVMSTHGRSGVSRWAFGSVTDRVIRHTKAAVLTVTPAGCRVS